VWWIAAQSYLHQRYIVMYASGSLWFWAEASKPRPVIEAYVHGSSTELHTADVFIAELSGGCFWKTLPKVFMQEQNEIRKILIKSISDFNLPKKVETQYALKCRAKPHLWLNYVHSVDGLSSLAGLEPSISCSILQYVCKPTAPSLSGPQAA
jgi:hypothetical protein